MNTQDIFNHVRDHLLKQGVRCIGKDDTGNEVCQYRKDMVATSPLRCAAGSLMRNEDYSQVVEGRPAVGAENLPVIEKFVGRALTMDEQTMVRKLQSMHDTRLPEVWADAMATIAIFYGLTP